MNKLFSLLMLTILLASCGQREEELLDPNIENDVVMRAQLDFTPIVEENEDSERKISYLTYRTLVPSAPLVSLDTHQKFVCALKESVDSINSQIQFERNTFRDLHDKLQREELTTAEELSITELLMKYRMIDKLKYYYSSTRFTSEEITSKLQTATKQYNKKHGLPPTCKFTVKKGKDFVELKAAIESDECRQAFLRRAQVIPSGLAISQAALESGWGTSRFAQQGNNLFGLQYRFSDRSELSKRRFCIASQKDPNRCLFKFNSINDALLEYFRFLNSGTYQPVFRVYRGAGEIDPTSCRDSRYLVDGLVNYAEEHNYMNLVSESMDRVCPLIKSCP